MTFQQKLMEFFRAGCPIECTRRSDVYRVMYTLTAYRCKTFNGLSHLDAREEMVSLMEEQGVIYIMCLNGTRDVITWDTKFTGTKSITVAEIDQCWRSDHE